jgi:hypothetical protein
MTIMCTLASAVWGGSSSSAAICSNALAVLRLITSAVVTASDRRPQSVFFRPGGAIPEVSASGSSSA